MACVAITLTQFDQHCVSSAYCKQRSTILWAFFEHVEKIHSVFFVVDCIAKYGNRPSKFATDHRHLWKKSREIVFSNGIN